MAATAKEISKQNSENRSIPQEDRDTSTTKKDKKAEMDAKYLKEGCLLAGEGSRENFLKAIEIFSKVNPPTARSLYLRANAHIQLGGSQHNQDAMRDLSYALNVCEISKSKYVDLRYEILYKQAWLRLIVGDYEQALNDYTKIIEELEQLEQLKDEPEATVDRENKEQKDEVVSKEEPIIEEQVASDDVGSKQGSKDEASDERQNSVQENTSQTNDTKKLKEQRRPTVENHLPKAYFSRGLVYECMNKLQEALDDMNRGVEKNPSPYYVYCVKRVQEALHRSEEDAPTKEKSVNSEDRKKSSQLQQEINDSSSGGSTNNDYESNYYNGLLLYDKGDYDEALRYFQKAYSSRHYTRKSQVAECLFRCGLCHYQKREKDKAQEFFERAFEKYPKHAKSLFRLGMIQASNKNYELALKSLTKASELAPNYGEIQFERAKVLEKMGLLIDAMRVRRSAMEAGQLLSSSIASLENSLAKMQKELIEHGESSMRYLKIGWLKEAMHNIPNRLFTNYGKENGKIDQNLDIFKEYIEILEDYRRAVKIDREKCCPEAYISLVLLTRKGEDYLEAHDITEKLLKNLSNSPTAKIFESFFVMVRKEEFLRENVLTLSEEQIHKIRCYLRQINNIKLDLDHFKHYCNANIQDFYEELSISLSNLLAAIVLGGCSEKVIRHNLTGYPSVAGNVLSLLSKGAGKVPLIGSVLQGVGDFTADTLKGADYNYIGRQLKQFGKCGDTVDMSFVAHEVARRLADRYEKQLLQLDNEDEDGDETCCKKCCFAVFECLKPDFTGSPIEKLALFAVRCVLQNILEGNFPKLKGERSEKRKVLVEILVDMISNAEDPRNCFSKCLCTNKGLWLPLSVNKNEKEASPITQENTKDSNNNQVPSATVSRGNNTPANSTVSSTREFRRFLLVDFYRGPGICHDQKEVLLWETLQKAKIPSNSEDPNKTTDQAEASNHAGSENDIDKDESSGGEDETTAKIEDKNKMTKDKGTQNKKAETSEAQGKKSANEEIQDGEEEDSMQNTDEKDTEQIMTKNITPEDEMWAGMPYMNEKLYGYRLGSKEEIKYLKEKLESSAKTTCSSCCGCCC